MKVASIRQLRAVLRAIEIGPFMAFHWAWEVTRATVGADRGWSVQLSFVGLDRKTGGPTVLRSRSEFIPRSADESAAVKTAWLLVELAVRHELMEAFHYRGVRVFDPHRTVEQLAGAAGLRLRALEVPHG